MLANCSGFRLVKKPGERATVPQISGLPIATHSEARINET